MLVAILVMCVVSGTVTGVAVNRMLGISSY